MPPASQAPTGMHPPSSAAPDAVQAKDDSRIGRQIAVGFGLVAATSVVMCAMLFSVIARVSGLVGDMRMHEGAIDRSHALATAVREQYAHQAHTIIEGNRHHLEHYQDWVDRVGDIASSLKPSVPPSEQGRLGQVVVMSRRLDRMFRDQMLPASEAGDRATVARLHEEADRISASAAKEADAIVRAVELGMVHAHVSATDSTRMGFGISALCMLLIFGLSASYTMRLRKAVLKPLAVIADAARRFGGGDFSVRVGAIGQGELRAVADAFDRMLEEISARERQVLGAERMAAIGQLAAGVAHEINNPIGIIRGYLKTMGPDSPPEALRDELRILDEEASACQRIAEDLLAYARAPELRVQPTAIGELIRESVRRFEDTKAQSGVRIALKTEPHTMAVDGGRIRQVLLNLLRNAAQVSPSGAPIEVNGDRRGDGYEIVVSDRGPGVKPEDSVRIFEPFFSQRADGSGLGLAVCQGIVRAHGGTIEVVSRPGGGATFRVRLPDGAAVTSERAGERA